MSLSLQLEAVLLLGEQVLGLVQIHEEQSCEEAGSQVQPQNEGYYVSFSESVDYLASESVGEGQRQNQEHDDLKDQEPEERNIGGVDHDILQLL